MFSFIFNHAAAPCDRLQSGCLRNRIADAALKAKGMGGRRMTFTGRMSVMIAYIALAFVGAIVLGVF